MRSLHSSTSGDERDLERLRRCERVGVERNAASTGVRYGVDVLCRVHTQQLFSRGRSGRSDVCTEFPPPSGDGVEHLSAFGTLGMARRWGVFFEPGRGQQQH